MFLIRTRTDLKIDHRNFIRPDLRKLDRIRIRMFVPLAIAYAERFLQAGYLHHGWRDDGRTGPGALAVSRRGVRCAFGFGFAYACAGAEGADDGDVEAQASADGDCDSYGVGFCAADCAA